MRLVIRDIVKNTGDEVILAGAGYSFEQGKVYGISGNENVIDTFLGCVSFETEFDKGSMVLDCCGKNCMSPAMVAQFTEEPAFPEFLTVREFLKYYIEINKKNIDEVKSMEEYLELVELNHVRSNRSIKDFTWEERVKLQFLCFIILTPPVLVIKKIKKINNVDFLKNIKNYLNKIKQNSIVIMGTDDKGVASFLCDEQLTIEKGYIQGGI